MIRDLLKIALGNLRQRKIRSWLTLIGIFIGIAAVVSLIGLGEGLRTAITGQFGFLGTDVLSIQASGINFAGPPGSGAVTPLSSNLVEKIQNINGVKAAFNRYIKTANVEFNDRQSIGFAINMPGGDNRKVIEKMLNLQTASGRLLRDTDTKKVILGENYARESIFGKQIVSGDKIMLNDQNFEVVGILKRKGSFAIDSAILLNDDDLFTLFEDEGIADIIAVQVDDESKIPQVKESIEKLLRSERNVKKGEEDFIIQTPQQAIESLNSTLFAVQLFVYIIATISLVVGGIGIMNTMYTAVLERTREIGVMKAIGARNSVIFTIFSFESGFLGLVGGLIGILLGAGLAYGLAALGRVLLGARLIQATISPELIIGALSFSFLLGTLFGALPAVQASRLQPVNALRK